MSGYRLGSEGLDDDFFHLGKPFTAAELASTLRKALSHPSKAGGGPAVNPPDPFPVRNP